MTSTVHEARTVSVTIRRTPQDVYAYAADPRNMPVWSFVESIEPIEEGWVATLPGGARSIMRFVPRNELGVLDHDVEVGPGMIVHVPLRVVSNGEGSEVLFTVLRTPGMTDDEFATDIATVEKDLNTLRSLLENS
jgi:Polyketide cyclase / dehydrase and lipid transport